MTINYTVHQTVYRLKLLTKLNNWIVTTQLITRVMLLTYSTSVFNEKLWGLFLYNHSEWSSALWKHSKRLN